MPAPTNTPQALVTLLNNWQQLSGPSVDPVIGRGEVGEGAGGPYDVLTISGSAGGAPRRVDVGIGQPFSIDLSLPPYTTQASPFIVMGLVGAPHSKTAYLSTIGPFAFEPHILNPSNPNLFTLANSYAQDPRALFPSTFAPWSLVAPIGLSFPATYTMQAVINDQVDPTDSFSIGNAVILRIQ